VRWFGGCLSGQRGLLWMGLLLRIEESRKFLKEEIDCLNSEWWWVADLCCKSCCGDSLFEIVVAVTVQSAFRLEMKFYNFFLKLFLTSAHQNDLKTWFFFYFKQKKHSKFLGMWFAVPKHTFSVCWSRHDFFFLVMWLLRLARVGQWEWLMEWRSTRVSG